MGVRGLCVSLVVTCGLAVLLGVVCAEDHGRDDGNIPYVIHDYTNHSCRRPCEGSEPKTCRYYFLVEHYTILGEACMDCPTNKSHCFLPQCVAANGVPRDILTVNRMMPGPDVDVCHGDTIEVVVDNRMALGEGTSIHWHGLRQRHSQHMDGTTLVTQCPIHSLSKMKYSFPAADPGTHYWHGHSSMQRALGLFGRLIIRQPQSVDPQGHLYDHDLKEHSLILSDWVRDDIASVFVKDYYDGVKGMPTSVLLNGIGSESQNQMGKPDGPIMPISVFNVEKGKRFRFRVLLSGILNCPVYMSVDNHTLLVIATDGMNTEPTEVNQITILSGERYDFVLNANQDGGQNYWIRFRGRGRCTESFKAVLKAVIRYDTAPDVDPPGEVTDQNTYGQGRVLNGMNYHEKGNVELVQVPDLNSLYPDPDVELTAGVPDHVHYISMGASKLMDPRFRRPLLPHQKKQKIRPTNHQLNYITSRLPPAPPLTEHNKIPKEMFCNNETVKQDCSKEMCECVHLYPYKLGEIIEFVMVSFSLTNIHPMHMHGHSFTVIGQKDFHRDLTVAEVKEMDARGELPRRTDNRAPKKDTMGVRGQSVVIIRFRADNPGFWFFHCHIEFHAETGMGIVLQEGGVKDMPRAPRGFKRCGESESQEVEEDPALESEFLLDMPAGYDRPLERISEPNPAPLVDAADNPAPLVDAADNDVSLLAMPQDPLSDDAVPAWSISDDGGSRGGSGISVDGLVGIVVTLVLVVTMVGYAVYKVRTHRGHGEEYVLLANSTPTSSSRSLGYKKIDNNNSREDDYVNENYEKILDADLVGY